MAEVIVVVMLPLIS